ncbi:MAG: peptide ABC transporter substrate-binding protein [Bdellovibrionales bacterium]
MRFHLITEPYTLDPALIRGSTGSYLLGNLFRGLYVLHSEKGLQPLGAKSCKWTTPTKLRCVLNPKHKWSDGTVIQSDHYMKAFYRLVDPKVKTVQWGLLKNVVNAKAIVEGQLPLEKLGIKAIDDKTLDFSLIQPDPEFIYNFIMPALSPVFGDQDYSPSQATKLITSGPYKIKSWKMGSKIELLPNEFYYEIQPRNSRPPIEIYFIEDDSTALNLYDLGRLNFLRRVGVSDIPALKNKDDFIQIPMSRMDFLGFGPELNPYPNLRKAMAHSLNYEELKKLYHALGKPGCPSLLHKYYGNPICYDYDLKKAKQFLDKVDPKIKAKRWKLFYSKLGGESIKKGMEWIQSQWKHNLGLTVELVPSEGATYFAQLNENPPALFRKGIGADRPTCRAGLEVFLPGHRENYINFNNNHYVTLVEKLNETAANNKSICREAISVLMNAYAMIPMGEIHFSMRVRKNIKGLEINEMNQLNLDDLSIAPSTEL